MWKRKKVYLFCLAAVCLFDGCGSVTKQPEVTERAEEHVDGKEDVIKKATAYIKEKKYPQAMGLLMKTHGNKQAEDLLRQLRYLVSGSYLANLSVGVAAVDNNGKVKIAVDKADENYDTYMESTRWDRIVSLSDAVGRLDALDQDGRIHSIEDLEPYEEEKVARLKSLKDISVMDTYFDSYIAVDKTGTVDVYSRKYNYILKEYKKQIASLEDVVDVVSGVAMIAALKRDGTVYVADYTKYICTTEEGEDEMFDEVSEWTDIVDISSVDGGSIVGLKSDGTVVIAPSREKGEMFQRPPFEDQIKDWKDIIAVSGGIFTLGLKRDGTVVVAGDEEEEMIDVSDWHDIVAISAGVLYCFGLKADGTIVMAENPSKEINREDVVTPDLSKMKNLYVPTIQYENTEK